MIYTADFLIERRKEKWYQDNDIERDKIFRETIVEELRVNEQLRNEIKLNPEKLIELTFIIVNKEKETVPFFLNEVQLDFLDILNKSKEDFKNGKLLDLSFLILKGRQLGFTTFITAYQLACTITTRNFEGYTIADSSDNAESIFMNKAKFMYNNLPEKLKPTEKYNTKRQLIFEKINSSWGIDSATKDMGRSRTINFLHASECAFWQYGIAVTQAGLGEALTKDSIKIYESTANGYNDFQKMWASGTCINCFYEWWRTKEYSLEFESEEIKQEFAYNINNKTEWIFTRLKWLKNVKRLKLNQLYWYYKKYEKYIEKDMIKQEYPCTPDDAFLSSGRCVFDSEQIMARIEEIKEKRPIKTGYFDYKYDDTKPSKEKISNIEWVDDPNGYIKIYEDVQKGYPYVIGGDTAGDGSDNFTGQVVNNITGNQVAVLKHQFDEDVYTIQMYCLGKYFNNALLSVEVNYSTFPVKELERLGYDNQFIREAEDTYTKRKYNKYGFKTTMQTRPLIISIIIKWFKENINKINDLDTLEEAQRFIRNEKGRAEAEVGYHDDLIMGFAICIYSREQGSFEIEEEEKEEKVLPFALQDDDDNDYEDEYIRW